MERAGDVEDERQRYRLMQRIDVIRMSLAG